jgi:hypothetical protein
MEPFLEFKGAPQLTSESKELAQCYIELVRYYSRNFEYVNTLETTMSRINNRISDEMKTIDRQLEQYNMAPIESYTVKKKMNQNLKKLILSGDVIGIIKAVFMDIKYSLYDFSMRLKNEDELYRLEEVGLDANKKGLGKATKIVWKYTFHDKIPSFDDVYDIIDADIDEEKYAKAYIGNNNKKKTETSYYKEVTKELSRTPTQHSTLEDELYAGKMLTEESVSRRLASSEVYEIKPSSIHSIEHKVNKQQIETDIINKEIQKEVLRDVMEKTGKSDANLERLEREIKELKIKNEELSLRLNEPTKINVEKLPIYTRYHIPFKGIDKELKYSRTGTTSCKEHIKCIEPIHELDLIALGDKTGHLIFMKLSTLVEDTYMSLGPNTISSLLYMNDSKTLFIGISDGKVARMILTDFKYIFLEGSVKGLRCLTNPLNGYTIFSAGKRNISEWSMIDNKLLSSWEAHAEKITDLMYLQQRDILVSCSDDKTIKIWNPITRENLGMLEGHLEGIKSITYGFVNDHINIVSLGKDNIITFWDLDNKEFTRSLKMKSNAKKILYLHDKNTYFSIHKNGKAYAWNTKTDECLETNINSEYVLTNGCYLDDGFSILLSTDDGRVILYN